MQSISTFAVGNILPGFNAYKCPFLLDWWAAPNGRETHTEHWKDSSSILNAEDWTA